MVQPCSGPSWMPSTSPPIASAESSEPIVSKAPSWSSRELPTNRRVSTNDTTHSTTGMANSQGHVNQSIMADEKNSPRIPPALAKPAQTPTARARSSCGNEEVITDRVTGMIIAAPIPATTRATSMNDAVVASPAAMLARENTVSPMSRTGLRPHRSPMAPIGSRRAASTIV